MTETDLAGGNSELQACGHKRQYEASWDDAESSHCSLCMVLRLHEQNRGLESNNARLREASDAVIEWWMREGIVKMYGAPACIFMTKEALAELPVQSLEAIRAEAINTVIESLKGYPEAKGNPEIYKEVARLSLEAIEQTADLICAEAKAEERKACAMIAAKFYSEYGISNGIAKAILESGDAG